MNTANLLGIFTGIVVGIAIGLLMLKNSKKDGKFTKSRFDERQELVRVRGYKYAFFTLIYYNVLFAIVDELAEKRFMDYSIELFIGVCISITVYASYCIWNEGYFALNDRPKYSLTSLVILGVCNIVLSINQLEEGKCVRDGRLTFNAVSLVIGIMMIVTVIVIIAKMISNKKEEE